MAGKEHRQCDSNVVGWDVCHLSPWGLNFPGVYISIKDTKNIDKICRNGAGQLGGRTLVTSSPGRGGVMISPR